MLGVAPLFGLDLLVGDARFRNADSGLQARFLREYNSPDLTSDLGEDCHHESSYDESPNIS